MDKKFKYKSILRYKDVFWQLTTKEIRVRYKQSIFGFLWAVMVPLLNLLVLSIIFSNFFKIPTSGIAYPVYLFVALVPWTFLTNAIVSATSSISGNSSLITKVYLPRQIFPLTSVFAKIIDFLLTFLILLAFLPIFGVSYNLTLVFVPLIFFVQLILVLGIALILSATNTFFRDIENILGVFLTMWMYLTPVIYSPQLIPEKFKNFFYLNPMFGIIDGYREVILFNRLPDLFTFGYSVVISTFIFVIGFIYFKNRAKYFADIV